MSKKFTRTIEDFTCAHCGMAVTGDGFTNHCPQCLYSKHVDINPGDRAAACGGLMQPIGVEVKNNSWVLKHHCRKCGHEMRCKTQEADRPAVLKLAKTIAEQKAR